MTQTNTLYLDIENLLKSIPEFLTEEKELRYNKIKEMAENGDVKLIEPLLKDEKMKNAFFAPIFDSFVFKTKEFKEFLDYSSSNNSYSQYLGKKIGLYMGDSALTDRSEVVLNFPYKDCVLEGGQTKEYGLDTYFAYDEKTGDYVEKTDKRREVFFNETLAKDEIDSLFSPKAFCNVKKFTKVGEEICTKFERNAELNKNRGLSEDTITDNLVIKGNNLLALHSLKKEFEGKVKLIYIDPPYNTGSDDFKYNDNFNHSSWLTFMKNRLEVARELLRDDGCIFVQCDDNESDYCKVIMDDLFDKRNFMNRITISARSPSAFSVVNPGLFVASEYILYYAKNRKSLKEKLLKVERAPDYAYDKWIENFEDTYDKWKFIPLSVAYKKYTEKKDDDTPLIQIKKFNKFIIENAKQICRYTAISDSGAGKQVVEIKQKSLQNPDKIFKLERNNLDSVYVVNGQQIAFYEKNITDIDGVKVPSSKLTDIWTHIAWEGIANEGKVTFKNAKKPEKLLKQILELSTDENDIVLDFFGGSGTTGATAHKMNRQYIMCEQMESQIQLQLERLPNVINGDTTGISKSVNWQGGGSFVYLELAEKNEKAMRLISACKNYDELVSIFENLSQKYFLHYNVKVNEFINKTCKEEEFRKLSLERQKEIFVRMLDLNQLYVNLDDRNDKDSGLSENDIKATEDFYQIAKDGQ